MFERPSGGDRVILVHIFLPTADAEEDINEFEILAQSAGADVVAVITGSRREPDAKYYIGRGKADEIREACVVHDADLIILNHNLTPAQERNLERLFKCRVLSRSGLILDIFAQRARSFEGQLQVELAQLQHMSTRLVRGWTHLERQKGGIGLRGPGETQLEVDRRLLRNRMHRIEARLSKVHKRRQQSRRARKRAALPQVALVGYTNAGKSTLFNRLTNAEVYADDRLFATLDPTLRRIELPQMGPAILADTVGFIRHLPHELIAAFRATLEEVKMADLLLHVVDAASQQMLEHQQAVTEVLSEIGADTVPQLMVFNKVDLLPEPVPGQAEKGEGGVWISCLQGHGLEDLQAAIVQKLSADSVCRTVCLPPTAGQLRAKLYEEGAVLEEHIDADGHWHLKVRLRVAQFKRFFGDDMGK